ncbi:MAG TPA: peptidoglycan editing factor PgeF [Gammaproteobacteria bacterium]|nr:peptidoglycan editing factor PgeF [Gammaproteobacteria bacterium]
MHAEWIQPDWPAPARVRAVSTTRAGGVSLGVYASLNLGERVGDEAAAIGENRRRLRTTLGLRQEPVWLKQVHGKQVLQLEAGTGNAAADAALSRTPGRVCAVTTADCLPVLFCDRAGTTVAAAHAGWRGLVAGVLEETIGTMGTATAGILAWLGPAIGPDKYEVGDEVRDSFLENDPGAGVAFRPTQAGKWLCDLYTLARHRLTAAGITHIYGGGLCTHTDRERFFSFRRDGECGRMASLIWLE